MKTLASGAPFCLSVTLLDGIVFAPTAVGHSVNYRSVVVMGKAEPVEGQAAKLAAMRDFVEYVIRGRWAAVRSPSEQELKGTMVLAVPLVEASAKVRTGFAVDDGEDYASPAWTGVLPMKWTAQAPVPDPRGNSKIPIPTNIQHYSRPQQVCGPANRTDRLLLTARARERRGHAERNQHSAGYVSLRPQPASIPVQMARHGSGEKRPKTVAHDAHSREERP